MRSRAKSAYDVLKDEEAAARKDLGSHYKLVDPANVKLLSETWRDIKSHPDRLRGCSETIS